jgi:hypothetical protein
MDRGKVGFLVSTPQIVECITRVPDPPDMVIVHPELESQIGPTMEFIAREYPDTTSRMWRDPHSR